MPELTPELTVDVGTDSSRLPLDAGIRSKRAKEGRARDHSTSQTGTGSRSILPTDDDEKKSRTVGRYQFRKDGAGWECREIIGRGAARKRAYLAHLSRTSYEQMQAKANSPEDLELILIQWADRKREGKRSIYN
jgi:hypothetical protein